LTDPRPDHLEAELSAYLDGELTAAEAAQVERWLAESPAARQSLEALRDIRAQLGQLPRHAAPASLRAALRQHAERQLLFEDRPARPGRWLRLMVQTSAAAAILLACVYVGWHTLQPVAIGPTAPDEKVVVQEETPPAEEQTLVQAEPPADNEAMHVRRGRSGKVAPGTRLRGEKATPRADAAPRHRAQPREPARGGRTVIAPDPAPPSAVAAVPDAANDVDASPASEPAHESGYAVAKGPEGPEHLALPDALFCFQMPAALEPTTPVAGTTSFGLPLTPAPTINIELATEDADEYYAAAALLYAWSPAEDERMTWAHDRAAAAGEIVEAHYTLAAAQLPARVYELARRVTAPDRVRLQMDLTAADGDLLADVSQALHAGQQGQPLPESAAGSFVYPADALSRGVPASPVDAERTTARQRRGGGSGGVQPPTTAPRETQHWDRPDFVDAENPQISPEVADDMASRHRAALGEPIIIIIADPPAASQPTSQPAESAPAAAPPASRPTGLTTQPAVPSLTSQLLHLLFDAPLADPPALMAGPAMAPAAPADTPILLRVKLLPPPAPASQPAATSR
jgi:hypothetical protein